MNINELVYLDKIGNRNVWVLEVENSESINNTQLNFGKLEGLTSFAVIENNKINNPNDYKYLLKKMLNIGGNISVYGPNAEKLENFIDTLISKEQRNDLVVTTTSEESLKSLLEWSILYSHPSGSHQEYNDCVIFLFPGNVSLAHLMNLVQETKKEFLNEDSNFENE